MVTIIQSQISHLNLLDARHLDLALVPAPDHHQENQDQTMFICPAIHTILNMPSMMLRLLTIMPIKLLVMVMWLPVNIVYNCLMVACKLYATLPIGKQAIMQMSVTKANLNSLRDLVADQATNTNFYQLDTPITSSTFSNFLSTSLPTSHLPNHEIYLNLSYYFACCLKA